MSEPLKPCPFCGGEASCEPLAKGCRAYAVLCVGRHDGSCMARQWGAWTRKSKAIAAWNRRALPSLTEEEKEALAAIVPWEKWLLGGGKMPEGENFTMGQAAVIARALRRLTAGGGAP